MKLLRAIPWEPFAAAATFAAAWALSDLVRSDARAVAERVGQAHYQLEALAREIAPVRRLAGVAAEDALPSIRARLRARDWSSLFGNRSVTVAASEATGGFALVLVPAGSAACSTP